MTRPRVFQINGFGPWAVDPYCPAIRHNTLNAARGNNGTLPCICLRGMFLLEREVRRYRRYNVEVRERATQENGPGPGRGRPAIPRWFTESGPCRILDECPAEGHNTLQWGRTVKDRASCICPRALVLLADARARARANDRRRRSGKRDTRVGPQKIFTTVMPASEPDWIKGACRQDLATADGGFDTSISHAGIANRQAAKDLCALCPIKRDCKAWIVKAEGHLAGSFGGVYGGLDPWNRRGKAIVADWRGKITQTVYRPDSE